MRVQVGKNMTSPSSSQPQRQLRDTLPSVSTMQNQRRRPVTLHVDVLDDHGCDESMNPSGASPSAHNFNGRSTGSTFRMDGVSIGRDYWRLNGRTLSRGELSLAQQQVTLCEVIGRGAFSTVYRAMWNRTTNGPISGVNSQNAENLKPSAKADIRVNNIVDTQKPRSNTGSKIVSVKTFRLMESSSWSSRSKSEERKHRNMLIRELKALYRQTTEKEDDDDEDTRTMKSSSCLIMLHGAFLVDVDTVAMVLEYMDQGSLHDYILANGSLLRPSTDKTDTSSSSNTRLIASVTYQMLLGLEHLHAHHIVHRDFKPANVLLHSEGSVKLCDFGLASLGTNNENVSLNTTMIGTTKYMAPERLRPKAYYGRSSDVWSLGLVVMECITGEPPWNSITSIIDLSVTLQDEICQAQQVLEFHDVQFQQKGSESLEQSTIGCRPAAIDSPGLEEILLSCLRKDPGTSLLWSEVLSITFSATCSAFIFFSFSQAHAS